MGLSRMRFQGFTLIELMLVSAIIGLLASIAIPKFGELIMKAREAVVKGKLGALRSTLHIYHADNEFPLYYYGAPGGNASNVGSPCSNTALYRCDDFASLVPKYINVIPEISIPRTDHALSRRMLIAYPLNTPFMMSGEWSNGFWPQQFAWAYHLSNCAGCLVIGRPIPSFRLNVLCTHTDLSGHTWSTH